MGSDVSNMQSRNNISIRLNNLRNRASVALAGAYIADVFTTLQNVENNKGGTKPKAKLSFHSCYAEEAYPILTSLTNVGYLDIEDLRRETVKHYRFCRDSGMQYNYYIILQTVLFILSRPFHLCITF